MAKCFTCGRPIDPEAMRYREQSAGSLGVFPTLYTCPQCEGLDALKTIRQQGEAQTANMNNISSQLGKMSKISSQLDQMSKIQEQGFESIRGELESGFAGVRADLGQLTSIVEWGFQDLNWRISQQTNVLKSIDKTLKTPLETQANELRQMAEGLFERGVTKEAESRFLRALEMNPLDYRAYVGLAHVYIREGNFGQARRYLENSLPIAPQKDSQLRSYSLRLIGRTYFCDEDNQNAAKVLKQAVDLVPDSPEAHYDYAQYSALIEDVSTSCSELAKAISLRPSFWIMSRSDRNFESIREQVSLTLSDLVTKAREKAQRETTYALSSANHILKRVTDVLKSIDQADELGVKVERRFNRSPVFEIERQTKTYESQIRGIEQHLSVKELEPNLAANKNVDRIADILSTTTHNLNKIEEQIRDFRTQCIIEMENMKQNRYKGRFALGKTFASYGALVTITVAVILTMVMHGDFGSAIVVFVVLEALLYGVGYGLGHFMTFTG